MKVKLPKVYDLNQNGKAYVLMSPDRKTTYLMSYSTIIAFSRMRVCGAQVTYRTLDSLSATSLRNWNEFADQWTPSGSAMRGIKGYMDCPKATVED